MYLNLSPPLNPIIGETHQGFINGCPFYLEQISHHPPICAFQLYGRGYKFEGYLESIASLGLNSAEGTNAGRFIVTFEDGDQIWIIHPTFMLNNMSFGDINFNFENKSFVFDVKNNLFSEINYNPFKKGVFSFG